MLMGVALRVNIWQKGEKLVNCVCFLNFKMCFMADLQRMQEMISANYKPCEYPALEYQIGVWSEQKQLEGLTVVDATPIFRNTMVKYLALIAAGAELVVGQSDVMPYSPAIRELLLESGIRIVEASDRPEGFVPDLILDCAASFISWPSRLGYVELTGSGIERYSSSGKRVYLADSGRIKRIETSLGTGESFFRAMAQLGYTDWAGRRLVLFGSGKVGRGILLYGVRNGAKVTVLSDLNTVSEDVRAMADRVVDFRSRSEVDEVLDGAYCVVTATGVVGAVESSADVERLVSGGALLANMGVEDEYGASVPTERVLECKRPLNFILEEPTHLKYIDATMALHNAGAECLAVERELSGAIMPSEQLEQELLDVSSKNGVIGGELSQI